METMKVINKASGKERIINAENFDASRHEKVGEKPTKQAAKKPVASAKKRKSE